MRERYTYMTTEAGSARVLPNGVSENAFDEALKLLRDVLGDDGLIIDDEGVKEFHDPYTFAEWDNTWPSAVAQPTTVAEVQAVVRIAAEAGIALWTTSQGRNNAYGGSAPRTRGSVVLNFRRMNKIIEINEEMGYAVVEPGVTFFDLYHELRRRGSKLWSSCPDLGWGSIVGNTLDHGFGYTANGDHASNACGFEVVLPSGELLRTGMGAFSDELGFAHQRGFGPSIDGLFTQSNLGIVTKMGRWLMPQPEYYASITVKADDDSGLEPMIEAVRGLMLEGVLHNPPIVHGVLGAAALVGPRETWHDGDGPLPESFYREAQEKFKLGYWNLRCAVYGSEGVVDAHIARVLEVFDDIPGLVPSARKVRGEDANEDTLTVHGERIQAGIPSLRMLETVAWWGGVGGHIDFSPVAPLRGDRVRELTSMMREEIENAGFDFWPGAIVTPRSFVYVSPIYFDTLSEERSQAAFDTYQRLVRRAADAGFPVYRGHIEFMDDIADTYGAEGHAYRRFLETIKDAVDPAGVLSPGKQGIWPSRLRTN